MVLWPKEEKAGVEPLSNVPETSRFVGAVTPVMFSGNKKWYPGKILMISGEYKPVCLILIFIMCTRSQSRLML